MTQLANRKLRLKGWQAWKLGARGRRGWRGAQNVAVAYRMSLFDIKEIRDLQMILLATDTWVKRLIEMEEQRGDEPKEVRHGGQT